MKIIDWSLIFALLAVIIVLYLCYVFSKFLSKKVNTISQTTNIKVLEKVILGQEKSLVISKICGKYYLIGVANENIQILKELDTEDIQMIDNVPMGSFSDILNSAMTKFKSNKTGVKNDKT